MTDRIAGKRGLRESHEPRLMLSLFKTAGDPGYQEWDGTHGITENGMDGNDRYSNCVVEGTEVQASHVVGGYRGHYSGPVIRLITSSGKELTVTPNHAVLTPGGFTRARFLKEGDDVICGCLPQGRESASDIDFNQAPARIEEIWGSLAFIGAPVPNPEYFHGDGRYMDGNIDVVAPDRLLGSELDATLGQPHSENEVISAGDLKGPFQGEGAPLQAYPAGTASALGGVGGSGDGSTLVDSHAGVHHGEILSDRSLVDSGFGEQPQEGFVADGELLGQPERRLASLVAPESLPEPSDPGTVPLLVESRSPLDRRTSWDASLTYPTDEGLVTDPELFGEIERRFPGLVATERITQINVESYIAHVYDLQTASGWYVANGIIVHNCGAAAVDHGNAAKADDVSIVGTLGYPVFATTLGTYFAYGTAMGEPGTMPDEGVDNRTFLGFLFTHGIIDGYGEVPLDELDTYAQDFDGLLIAVLLDDDAEADFGAGIPWDTNAANPPDPNLGHDVWLIITHADGSIGVYTWGAVQAATLAFRTQNITDAWAILDEDDAKRTGVNWAALQAELQSIHGTVSPLEPSEPSPVVTPPPTPPSPPEPVPSPSAGILRQVIEDIEKAFDDILNKLEELA
jgi:hypothetical protein